MLEDFVRKEFELEVKGEDIKNIMYANGSNESPACHFQLQS